MADQDDEKIDIDYSIAKSEDSDEICRFLAGYFLFDEPINVTVGLSDNVETMRCIRMLTENCVRDGVSSIARYKGVIVGSRLSYIENRNQQEAVLVEAAFDFEVMDAALNRVKQFLCVLEDGLELLLPDCKRLLRFENVSVRPDLRRRGIAKRMSEVSIEAGRRLGCDAAVTLATNASSQKLFASLNFKTLKSLAYEDYFEIDGGRILPPGEIDSKMMVLKL